MKREHGIVVPMLATALLLVATAGVGCEQDGGPTKPDPVGGGQTFVLDAALYRQAVAPVLAQRGCDVGGDCHGGESAARSSSPPRGTRTQTSTLDRPCCR